MEGCFPAAAGLPEQNRYKKLGSDDVLAMAEAECRCKGVGPHQPMHAGTRFRAQGPVEQKALQDAVGSMPGGDENRQRVLGCGHEA
eukprot:5073276-Alexandrium_andersonii.AAC.1